MVHAHRSRIQVVAGVRSIHDGSVRFVFVSWRDDWVTASTMADVVVRWTDDGARRGQDMHVEGRRGSKKLQGSLEAYQNDIYPHIVD